MTTLTEQECLNLGVFLAQLRLKAFTDKIDAITNAVIETGGDWKLPSGNPSNCFDQIHEIQLFGVVAAGISTADAVTNWIRDAQAVVDAGAADLRAKWNAA